MRWLKFCFCNLNSTLMNDEREFPERARDEAAVDGKAESQCALFWAALGPFP
jgi:hypothetical protein